MMSKLLKTMTFLISASAALLAGCGTSTRGEWVTARSDGQGGIRIVRDEPLGLNDSYSFKFADTHRISFKWLTGPIHVGRCSISRNTTGLGDERNLPFVERDGVLYDLVPNKDQKSYRLRSNDQQIYGVNPGTNDFVGYSSVCGAFFKDSLDGIVMFIVEPDSKKGTDEWIEGAEPVQLNGLTWWVKKEPIQDPSATKRVLAAPIEYWTLKIPQTRYWMTWRFSANSGEDPKFKLGAKHFPEQHQKLLDLFRQMVASVKLEPIEPLVIPGPVVVEAPKK
jgi:hypothetical protein